MSELDKAVMFINTRCPDYVGKAIADALDDNDRLQQQNAELKSRLSDAEIVGERWLAWHDADVIEKATGMFGYVISGINLDGTDRAVCEVKQLYEYANQLRNQSKEEK